jgi:hypothetical protein
MGHVPERPEGYRKHNTRQASRKRKFSGKSCPPLEKTFNPQYVTICWLFVQRVEARPMQVSGLPAPSGKI